MRHVGVPLHRFLILVLAMLLVLAACQGADDGQTTESPDPVATGESPEAATQTLRIGAAVALTGGVSREGNLVRDGYEYWMNVVNEQGGIDIGGERYEVEIVFYDDESDAGTGTRLTERLISEDDVDFLLSPFSSGITQATTTIAERNQVLTIASMANADDIYERGYQYVFSILPPGSSYLRGVIDMALAQNPPPSTAAVLIRDDPFGIAAGEGAITYLEEQGVEVVLQERYPADATDLSTVLTSVARADPDILLASTLFEDSALITRQAKDQGLAPNLIAFTVGPALPDFVESLGADAEYVVGSEWWLPSVDFEGEETLGSTREYADGIEEAYGYVPGYHTAGASMAGLVLQLALEQAGTLDPDAVREALLQMEPETFWGPIGWDESGKNILGTSIPVQIQDGQAQAVWPPEGRQVEPVYPFPPWDER